MKLKQARTVSFKTMVEDKDAEYHLATSEAGEIFKCFGKGVNRDWGNHKKMLVGVTSLFVLVSADES